MKIISIFILGLLSIDSSFSQSKNDLQPKIDGWYFRAKSGYPVSITFEPIVLFKDGSYFQVDEEPIEDLDFKKSKKNQAELWGVWKKNNAKFILTNFKGKSKEYDLKNRNWFPAFPFNKSIKLKGTYEKISGGNFGNEIYALFNSQINFLDGKHFTHSENSGVNSYTSQAWKSTKNAGTYIIDGNTILFEYNDRRKVRLSFAIGAQGKNVIDTDMIFIGGKAYVIE